MLAASGSGSHDLIDEGDAEAVPQAADYWLTDDQLGDVVLASEAQQLFGRVVTRKSDYFCPQLFRQTEVLRELRRHGLGHGASAARLDVDRVPAGVERAGHAPRGSHQARRVGAGAHGDQQLIAHVPGMLDALGLVVLAHLRVHTLGRMAQRQLAQRDQVALLEEIVERALRLRAQVDFTFAQTLQ